MKELFKKSMMISMFIAIIITLICFIIDRIYIGQTSDSLFKIGDIQGGEVDGSISTFGWTVETYYPMTSGLSFTNEPINNLSTTNISFNIFIFLVGFIKVLALSLIVGLIVFSIICLVRKIRNKSIERNEQK